MMRMNSVRSGRSTLSQRIQAVLNTEAQAKA